MSKFRRIIANVLLLAIIGSFIVQYINRENSFGASKTPKFSVKKITVTEKKTKSIYVKNAKKAKFKWKSKNKKYATVKSIGKGKAKIKGIKKGSTKITCKVVLKKRKYNLSCSVKVKAAHKNAIVKTEKPFVNPTASPTVTPTSSTVEPTPTSEITAKITVKIGAWTTFLEVITFGLYHDDEQEVEITASSTGGIKTIEYCITDENVSLENVGKLAFVIYNNANRPTLRKGTNSIVYAKITNNDGDNKYIRSDGIVINPDPTESPTVEPTASPTTTPATSSTATPIVTPTANPTATPTVAPTTSPTAKPTASPTVTPTVKPTVTPMVKPTASPTATPTVTPTTSPTAKPTASPTASPTATPTANPAVSPSTSPTENPTQPTIPVGYKAIDLSTYTSSDNSKVNYDNVTGILKVTGSLNALNFALDNVLNAGEQVHLIVRGSHEGTSSFRCMLGDYSTAVSNIPITNGLSGDGVWSKYYGFLWQYTMTVNTGSSANLFMFKGPNGGTNLDNLTIYSILIKYGGEPEPSLYKLQPVVETKPIAQEINYGEPLSSAILSGGIAKYGNTIVEGTFSWYSPTTVPAGGTSFYTVKFTPTGAFSHLYNPTVCQLSVTPTGYTESSNDVLYESFDDGTKGAFTDRWATAVIDDNGYSGKCLKGTARTAAYTGLQVDITSLMKEGNTYSISAYGKTAAGATLNMTIVKTMGTDTYDGIDTKTPSGEWVKLNGSYTVPNGCTKFILFFQTNEAGKNNDIFIDEIKVTRTNIPTGEAIVGSLKDSYIPIFGYVGGAIPYPSLKSEKHMSFVKNQFNSISMENEMKPDAILGSSAITQSSLPSGYIPNETYKYQDSSYLKLNFSKVDECIDLAYNAGIKMRFHVLLWHAQTPKWFFTENFNASGNYVSAETMNGRLEYYIRNVMNYVYNTEHGKDVVYCWDVVNEYTHNYDGGQKPHWDQVYYSDYTYVNNTHSGIWDPSYVIEAFTIADNQLSKLEAQGKIPNANDISLFYNDYNEYIETDNIINLINNVNKNKKVCDGVGMQMHLDINYPNPSATGPIASAIDKFNNAGLEIQLTEIDVTNYNSGAVNDAAQIQYYDTLFQMLVAKKNAGVNITGITFWGLDDTSSWRASGKPLLFNSLSTAKPMYFSVLEAANNFYGN